MKIICNIFENVSNNTYYYYTHILSCLKEIIPNAVQQATNQNSDYSDYSLIPNQSEPTQSEPRQSEPRQSEPNQSESTQSEPTQSEPTQSEPTQSEQSNITTIPTQSEQSSITTIPTQSEPEPSEQSSIIYSTIPKKFTIYRNIETPEFKEPLLINSSKPLLINSSKP